MRVLIVSSSLDSGSRSERLAQQYRDALFARSIEAQLIFSQGLPAPAV